ncbi:hypothetical protein GYMLUDRAFT_905357 [Collybiopsis luxurians FD-317 M1]|uniref:WW domain-containing protein n=1 Tax=Collybiopsis luxurians FD-317 M1 TaxID=944289 RepID=A0A0D0BXE1_9AGAR|nr:hypothetical protein GYMLUDRAFT_905357 [Collybiopsis luxurians FD-317 M1]
MQSVAPVNRVNPDRRGLPAGWKECYNAQKDTWYYVQTDINPPRISYFHPSGDSYVGNNTAGPSSSSSSSYIQSFPSQPMDLKLDQKLHIVDESGSVSSSSTPLHSAGPSTSGGSNSSAPPPISTNVEQEVVHLPSQATSAPDSADVTSPAPPEYSLYSESPIEPPATNGPGSDRPTGNNNTTSGTNGLPPGYSNSVPATTGPSPSSTPQPPPQIAQPPVVSVSPALTSVSGANQRPQTITSQALNAASLPSGPRPSLANVQVVQQASSPSPSSPITTTSPSGPRPRPAAVVQQTSITTSAAGPRPNTTSPVNRPPSQISVHVPPSPAHGPAPASGEGMTLAQRLFASAKTGSGGPTIHLPTDTQIHMPPTISASAVSAQAYNLNSTRTSSLYGTGMMQNIQQQQQQHQGLPGRPTGGRPSSSISFAGANQTGGLQRPAQQLQSTLVRPQSQVVGHHIPNSTPATGTNTVVRPRPTTLPNVTLVARPPSQGGTGMPGSTGSMDQLPVSSPQPLPGTNPNAAIQGQIGVSGVHSPPPPTPSSAGSFGHGVSPSTNASISNPSQPYAQAQAPLQHASMNPLPPIPQQQQQNLVTVASPPPNVLPVQGGFGNIAPGPQSPPLPARPPQHPQYTGPAGYTPPSVSVPTLPQRPPLHPGTSLPILPSQLPQSQLLQSSPSNTLSATTSQLGSSLSSSLHSLSAHASPALMKYGKVAGRIAGKAALRYGTKYAINSIFGSNASSSSNDPPLFDQDTLSDLNSSLSNLDVSDMGLDPLQFQDAFAGNPGVDYSGLINSIGQQQQTNPNPGVNYGAIIHALTKIQHAAAASHGHGQGHGHANANAHHAAGVAPNAQVQQVMNAQNQQLANANAQIQYLQAQVQAMNLQNQQQQQQQMGQMVAQMQNAVPQVQNQNLNQMGNVGGMSSPNWPPGGQPQQALSVQHTITQNQNQNQNQNQMGNVAGPNLSARPPHHQQTMGPARPPVQHSQPVHQSSLPTPTHTPTTQTQSLSSGQQGPVMNSTSPAHQLPQVQSQSSQPTVQPTVAPAQASVVQSQPQPHPSAQTAQANQPRPPAQATVAQPAASPTQPQPPAQVQPSITQPVVPQPQYQVQPTVAQPPQSPPQYTQTPASVPQPSVQQQQQQQANPPRPSFRRFQFPNRVLSSSKLIHRVHRFRLPLLSQQFCHLSPKFSRLLLSLSPRFSQRLSSSSPRDLLNTLKICHRSHKSLPSRVLSSNSQPLSRSYSRPMRRHRNCLLVPPIRLLLLNLNISSLPSPNLLFHTPNNSLIDLPITLKLLRLLTEVLRAIN